MNRLILAFRVFWLSLTDRSKADQLDRALEAPSSGPDLRILGLLQRDGRLVDFLQEDIDPYSDAQVGAAVREIHRGCRKALHDYLTLEPVLGQAEGDQVTLLAGFNPNEVRLSGNVSGNPPYRGVLKHHGWKVTQSNLPAVLGGPVDRSIVAPAEVELP